MKEKFKKFLKEFLREGGFAFSVAGLCYLFLAITGIIMLLSGCGQAIEAHQKLERRGGTDSLSVTIRPGEMDAKKGFYAAEDLGSHVMYVTHPTVDLELQRQMNEYGMDVVEVYFAKDEGAERPAFEAEPATSAVYYFYQKESGDEITISWTDTKGECPLASTVHLDNPNYVMKYVVVGRDEQPEMIDCFSMSDYTGGEFSFLDVKNSYFSIDSLMIDINAIRSDAGAPDPQAL